jgi:hypothetical protein
VTVFYAITLAAIGLLLAFGPRIDRWLRKTPKPRPPVEYGPLEKRQLPAAKLLSVATVLDPVHRMPPGPLAELPDEHRLALRRDLARLEAGEG